MITVDTILTHEDIFSEPGASLERFTRYHYRMNGNGLVGDEIHGEALARIDDGKWIVDCPSPYCNSAAGASKVDRRFICCECGSSDNQGRWRTVIFPDDMEEIEAALLARPGWLGRGTPLKVGLLSGGPRFWTSIDLVIEQENRDPVIMQPGQTLADLLRENEELGLDDIEEPAGKCCDGGDC